MNLNIKPLRKIDLVRNLSVLIDFIYSKEFYIRHINNDGRINENVKYDYLFELKKKSYSEELNGLYDLRDITAKEFNEFLKTPNNNITSLNYNELRWQVIYNEIENLEKDYVLFDIYSDGNRVTDSFKKIIIEAQNNHCHHIINVGDIGLLNYEEYVITKITDSIKEAIMNELSTTLPKIEIKYSSLGKIVFEYKFQNNKKESTSLFHSIITSKPKHKTFDDIRYLSPVKSHNNRIFENKSSFALDSLIHGYQQRITHDFKREEVEQFIREALKIFGIKGELEINVYEEYIATVSIKNDNKITPLNDLGFGYTQLIALALFLVSNYEFYPFYQEAVPISIIEEPESNLHPNLQSKIADLFNLFYNSLPYVTDYSFVIETHSEYLIRKFQYLVAKGELDPKNIIIHYFNADEYVNEDEPKVKHIEITKSGSLSDTFGPGFYDEAIKLQFDLLNINKEQNN